MEALTPPGHVRHWDAVIIPDDQPVVPCTSRVPSGRAFQWSVRTTGAHRPPPTTMEPSGGLTYVHIALFRYADYNPAPFLLSTDQSTSRKA
jgi:hypothetical protein